MLIEFGDMLRDMDQNMQQPLYELRIYKANPGKIDALLSRFRDHTVNLFSNHGMESIGYWISVNEPDVLKYIIKHHGIPADNWQAFIEDPVWIEAKATSEVNGALVDSIESHYLTPTDFSKLK